MVGITFLSDPFTIIVLGSSASVTISTSSIKLSYSNQQEHQLGPLIWDLPYEKPGGGCRARMKKAEIFTSPRYLCVRRNSNIGTMLSGLLKRCDERCLLRNCTPFPIDLGIFSRGNLALKGPKSNSSTNGSTELQPKKTTQKFKNSRIHINDYQVPTKFQNPLDAQDQQLFD